MRRRSRPLDIERLKDRITPVAYSWWPPLSPMGTCYWSDPSNWSGNSGVGYPGQDSATDTATFFSNARGAPCVLDVSTEIAQLTTQNTLPSSFSIKIQNGDSLLISGSGNSDISYANLIQAGAGTGSDPIFEVENGTLTNTGANFNTGLAPPRMDIVIDEGAVWNEGDPGTGVLKTIYATNVDITLGNSGFGTAGTMNIVGSNSLTDMGNGSDINAYSDSLLYIKKNANGPANVKGYYGYFNGSTLQMDPGTTFDAHSTSDGRVRILNDSTLQVTGDSSACTIYGVLVVDYSTLDLAHGYANLVIDGGTGSAVTHSTLEFNMDASANSQLYASSALTVSNSTANIHDLANTTGATWVFVESDDALTWTGNTTTWVGTALTTTTNTTQFYAYN